MVIDKGGISDVDISCIFWEITKRLSRSRQRFLEGFGLTASQMEILGALYHNLEIGSKDEMTQITLSKLTYIDPMTTSTILKNLEKKELIYRTKSKTDSRAFCVDLSEKGKSLFANVIREVDIFRKDMFRDIDKEVLFFQLSILLENIKKII
jgi:MarR family transcriptional regulator, organic hydroperoxide resistance regulator